MASTIAIKKDNAQGAFKLIPPLNPYSPQEIQKFTPLDLALRSLPEFAREGATILNPKALARLVQGLKGFQDAHLGRLESSRYLNTKNYPLMKLPDEFFRMRDPEGPLFTMIMSAYRQKKESSWRQFDFTSKIKYAENIKLMKRIETDLLDEGHLKRPVVFLDETIPKGSVSEYRKIVKRYGGRTVKDICNDAVTHVVAWDAEEHDSDETLETEMYMGDHTQKLYLKTLAVVDPKEKKKGSGGIIETTMQDSKKKGGKVKGAKGTQAAVFEHPMAYVHWWYHPTSYDEWMAAADVAGADTDVAPKPDNGPWIVGAKFIRDVPKFNEWGTECDYAISDYENKVTSFPKLEKKLLEEAKAREAAKPTSLKIRLTISSQAKAKKQKTEEEEEKEKEEKAKLDANAKEEEKKLLKRKKESEGPSGMEPRQIGTGFYNDNGTKVRKTVFDGALRVPKGLIDQVREAIKGVEKSALETSGMYSFDRYKLPGMNDMVRPSLDPDNGNNFLVTELRKGKGGSTLVTARRLATIPAMAPRIRGGGDNNGDVDMEDVSNAANGQAPAPQDPPTSSDPASTLTQPAQPSTLPVNSSNEQGDQATSVSQEVAAPIQNSSLPSTQTSATSAIPTKEATALAAVPEQPQSAQAPTIGTPVAASHPKVTNDPFVVAQDPSQVVETPIATAPAPQPQEQEAVATTVKVPTEGVQSATMATAATLQPQVEKVANAAAQIPTQAAEAATVSTAVIPQPQVAQIPTVAAQVSPQFAQTTTAAASVAAQTPSLATQPPIVAAQDSTTNDIQPSAVGAIQPAQVAQVPTVTTKAPLQVAQSSVVTAPVVAPQLQVKEPVSSQVAQTSVVTAPVATPQSQVTHISSAIAPDILSQSTTVQAPAQVQVAQATQQQVAQATPLGFSQTKSQPQIVQTPVQSKVDQNAAKKTSPIPIPVVQSSSPQVQVGQNPGQTKDSELTSSSGDEKAVFPRHHTEALMKRIQRLATIWTDEEIMNGNKSFSMNAAAVKTIAIKVPLSVEELKIVGVLEESLLKEYGDRLIRNINSYIDQNGLQEHGKKESSSAVSKPKPSNVAEMKALPDGPGSKKDKSPLTGEQEPTTEPPSWYDPKGVSNLEKSLLPEWFDGSADHRSKSSYISARESIIDVARKSRVKYLTSTTIRKCVAGDAGSIMRLHHFMNTWGFINGSAVGDTAPLQVKKQKKQKRKENMEKWTPLMAQSLAVAVAESTSKKRKLDDIGGEQLEVDWDAVSEQVGHGLTSTECQNKFLTTNFNDIKGEQNNVKVVSVSSTSEDTSWGDLIGELVDGVRPQVAKAAIDAAMNSSNGDLDEAQKASVLATIASKAAERAREEEAATSRILQEILDQRMKKLENRLSLLDDLEGMLDAERMAMELERRDLYTNRCRHWFNGDT